LNAYRTVISLIPNRTIKDRLNSTRGISLTNYNVKATFAYISSKKIFFSGILSGGFRHLKLFVVFIVRMKVVT